MVSSFFVVILGVWVAGNTQEDSYNSFLKEKVIKSLKEIQVKENHWNEMNTTVQDMK